jgi:hypothetical protein
MLSFDDMTPRQRVEHFDKRHGGDAIEIDHWLYFSDGAMRELNPLGLLAEPPAEPYDAAKIRLRYHEEKLRRASRAFDERKAWLLNTARANLLQRQAPPPPIYLAAAKRELNTLKRAVMKLQNDLEKARRDVEASKPAWLRTREEGNAASRASNEAFVSAIEEISI